MESNEIKPENHSQQPLIFNQEISIWGALLPLFLLILLLFVNVKIFENDATSGPNQFVLIIAGAIAAIVGFKNKVSYEAMMEEVAKNVKSTSSAILILLMVGALTGTWLLSGVIPSMIYYGLQILHPSYFLPACLIICSIISVATGSSWVTSATVGVAMIGIGQAMGMNLGMVAGAVVSGAYFGDKLSPLSDTTNLAPAMAGTDLFTHIKYMLITTIPTFIISLILFIILGFFQITKNNVETDELLNAIEGTFYITPWLFIVPIIVIGLIIKKTEPLIALLIGTLLAGVFALIFQPNLVVQISGLETFNIESAYKGILNALTSKTQFETTNPSLNELFQAKGMAGMLPTIWLVLCAMVFGGVMEAIGALTKITQSLLKLLHSILGLFASTVASCLALNITASDQYLAIVVPGKMFAKAYQEKDLAPENLSRTLEDAGTVTSALIFWNTCGAYQAQVLKVDTLSYLPYAFFNILSPFVTIIVASLKYKIKTISGKALN
jgi:Na+:H+ antiporter, NhaC family